LTNGGTVRSEKRKMRQRKKGGGRKEKRNEDSGNKGRKRIRNKKRRIATKGLEEGKRRIWEGAKKSSVFRKLQIAGG